MESLLSLINAYRDWATENPGKCSPSLYALYVELAVNACRRNSSSVVVNRADYKEALGVSSNRTLNTLLEQLAEYGLIEWGYKSCNDRKDHQVNLAFYVKADVKHKQSISKADAKQVHSSSRADVNLLQSTGEAPVEQMQSISIAPSDSVQSSHITRTRAHGIESNIIYPEIINNITTTTIAREEKKEELLMMVDSSTDSIAVIKNETEPALVRLQALRVKLTNAVYTAERESMKLRLKPGQYVTLINHFFDEQEARVKDGEDVNIDGLVDHCRHWVRKQVELGVRSPYHPDYVPVAPLATNRNEPSVPRPLLPRQTNATYSDLLKPGCRPIDLLRAKQAKDAAA